jgi:hypothetical protein
VTDRVLSDEHHQCPSCDVVHDPIAHMDSCGCDYCALWWRAQSAVVRELAQGVDVGALARAYIVSLNAGWADAGVSRSGLESLLTRAIASERARAVEREAMWRELRGYENRVADAPIPWERVYELRECLGFTLTKYERELWAARRTRLLGGNEGDAR